jgi:hypothetical protein
MVFSASGGLSTQQQKKAREAKRKSADDMNKADYRRVMAKLAAAIKEARGKVRQHLVELRERCKAERETVASEARETYAKAVAAARAARDASLKGARKACLTRGTTALAEAKAVLDKLEEDKAGRAREVRASRAFHKKRPEEKTRVTGNRRARERRQESDDEVRGNIEPRLVPLFEMLKEQVKGNDRLSRTEAFQQMYDEDRGNYDAILWQEQERAAQERYMEEEYRKHKQEQAHKERVERSKQRKRSQAQFADASGRPLAEKKGKQTSILDAPHTKRQSADALFGVPF